MKVNYLIENGVLTFSFNGELDEFTSSFVRGQMDDVIDGSKFQKVVFDLENLAFADSTGIGLFLGRFKRLQKLGVDAFIKNPKPQIHKVFSASGIYEILPKI